MEIRVIGKQYMELDIHFIEDNEQWGWRGVGEASNSLRTSRLKFLLTLFLSLFCAQRELALFFPPSETNTVIPVGEDDWVGKTIKLILAINQRTNNRQSSSSRRRKGKKFHVTIKNEIIFCEGKSIEFKFFHCSLFCRFSFCFGDKILAYIFTFVLKWAWKKLKLDAASAEKVFHAQKWKT